MLLYTVGDELLVGSGDVRRRISRFRLLSVERRRSYLTEGDWIAKDFDDDSDDLARAKLIGISLSSVALDFRVRDELLDKLVGSGDVRRRISRFRLPSVE